VTFEVYLSAPNVGELEKQYVMDALDSGWVAPLGPHVDAFERELADFVGVEHAVALSSGSAGLHLSLLVAGVKAGDEVVVPTLTFAATAFAVTYVGATPVFLDSETQSWNLDPDVLESFLADRAASDRLPAAVLCVDIFGQTADYQRIESICEKYGVALLEDAAEALGASNGNRKAGSFGKAGTFSFNGNKIITTSGGGMVVSNDGEFIDKIRYFATQARQPLPWYEHEDIGYNYRLSNVLAAIGRAQLQRLPEFIKDRTEARAAWTEYFAERGGATVLQDAPWGVGNSWLTIAFFEDAAMPEIFRKELAERGIEARPVWKPMHMQPVFHRHENAFLPVSENSFLLGICLPSLMVF